MVHFRSTLFKRSNAQSEVCNDTLDISSPRDCSQDWKKTLKEPKILILVLAINKDPWRRIEIEGQLPTWKSEKLKNIEVYRYTGSTGRNLLWHCLNRIWEINQKVRSLGKGKFSFFPINKAVKSKHFSDAVVDVNKHEIETDVPDLYSLIGVKTLEAFEASLKNFDFDYLYRTNVSSYIDLNGLSAFLECQPKENFYAGVIGNHQGVSFASGCGYFLSRDLVSKVVQKKTDWDHNYIDDVSLGKLLTEEMDIQIKEVRRVDLSSEVLDSSEIKNIFNSAFHFRCKAANPDITISIMKTLHTIRKNL
jgi:hypothetical protein